MNKCGTILIDALVAMIICLTVCSICYDIIDTCILEEQNISNNIEQIQKEIIE